MISGLKKINLEKSGLKVGRLDNLEVLVFEMGCWMGRLHPTYLGFICKLDIEKAMFELGCHMKRLSSTYLGFVCKLDIKKAYDYIN